MTTVTPAVPSTNEAMSSIMAAFPGLNNAGAIGSYYGRYPYLPSNVTKQSISYSTFQGINALTRS